MTAGAARAAGAASARMERASREKRILNWDRVDGSKGRDLTRSECGLMCMKSVPDGSTKSTRL